MTKPLSVKLLDPPIPIPVAAELLGCDPDLFADARNLTLRDAFRLALRPALVARQVFRGQRRGVMFKELARATRSTASVDAGTAALAIRMASRHVAADLDQQADRLATIDAKAAERLRGAA